MAADATLILAAVKSVLAGLYPDTPVRTSKRAVASGRQLEGGYQQGLPADCIVVSCGEPEEIDKRGSFMYVTVGYPVLVEVVKPAQAAVTGAVDQGAPTVVEDPAVRDQRAAIRAALYKPKLAGAPAVYDVHHESRPPYETTAEGRATLVVSGEKFVFVTTEPRPR